MKKVAELVSDPALQDFKASALCPTNTVMKGFSTYNFEIQFNLKFCLSSRMHLVPDETYS